MRPSSVFIIVILFPVMVAVILYQLDTCDPAPFPEDELLAQKTPPLFVPKENGRMLKGSEKIGESQLLGPEDLAYDAERDLIYTGCHDGWVARVTVNESAADSVVEKWVNTGGRPLGIVLGFWGELIVADARKGLLNISRDGTIELLTDEAEGLKFKLTDAVDIDRDGVLYFTDATHKHALGEEFFDFLEGRPNGRLLSYEPSTKQTKVLVQDLYFANGVAVSADQTFVIFCETPMRRCKKWYIKGQRKGSVDIFVENLPGLPDNINYDGEGQYWIGLPTGRTYIWDLAQRYPFIRKVLAVITRYIGWPNPEKNGGVIAVDLDGKPTAYYHDHDIALMTSGIKIRENLYCGSLVYPYIFRLNAQRYPATAG